MIRRGKWEKRNKGTKEAEEVGIGCQEGRMMGKRERRHEGGRYDKEKARGKDGHQSSY